MTSIQKRAERAADEIVRQQMGMQPLLSSGVMRDIIAAEFAPFEQCMDALIMARGYIAAMDVRASRLKLGETSKTIDKALAEIEKL